MGMENSVYTTVTGFIGEVFLNRPDTLNAFSSEMWVSLTERLQELEDDRNVQVVMITGVGKQAFSAGMDFADLAAVAEDPGRCVSILDAIERAMSTIELMSKPVIAKINGAAIGGGCELAAACDLRIAAETAKFGIPAGRLGIAITWQDTRRLSALVGTGWTKELLMTGQIIDSATAHRIGLVTRVVPSADLDREAEALAVAMAKMSAHTLQAAKRYTLSISQGRELGSVGEGLALAREAWSSEDFRDRVKALKEQRGRGVAAGGQDR
jgi:enoyl-CoA hydratase/carnithine racemase